MLKVITIIALMISTVSYAESRRKPTNPGDIKKPGNPALKAKQVELKDIASINVISSAKLKSQLTNIGNRNLVTADAYVMATFITPIKQIIAFSIDNGVSGKMNMQCIENIRLALNTKLNRQESPRGSLSILGQQVNYGREGIPVKTYLVTSGLRECQVSNN